jgi:tyrosyl-tRNA synthetase
MSKGFVDYFEDVVSGVVQVFPIEDLKKKLLENRPLRIKLGADPTSPNLHLGHAVVLQKLKVLQRIGHKIIFLIGDFTARIGDPTGKSKTRPVLSEQDVERNSRTYFEQISRFLDIERTEIVYNSKWITPMNTGQWLRIFSSITLARLIEREDFKRRINESCPIGFHELIYPLMQGYDSVYLNADIEIGGTDQTFNLIIGRHLQEQFGLSAQVVMTMPLLEGLDGINKMSKSLGNDIGLLDSPEDVFGKIMSISDLLMWRYYKILLNALDSDIEDMKKNCHPMDCKKKLAKEILIKFWSSDCAEIGLRFFEDVFQKKNYLGAPSIYFDKEQYSVVDLLVFVNSAFSRSEARRLILAGAVSLNNIKIFDEHFIIKLKDGDVLKVGKLKVFTMKKKI